MKNYKHHGADAYSEDINHSVQNNIYTCIDSNGIKVCFNAYDDEQAMGIAEQLTDGLTAPLSLLCQGKPFLMTMDYQGKKLNTTVDDETYKKLISWGEMVGLAPDQVLEGLIKLFVKM